MRTMGYTPWIVDLFLLALFLAWMQLPIVRGGENGLVGGGG